MARTAETTSTRLPNTNPDLIIVKDVKGNPRREDSWGFQSFGVIKSGMTVRRFVENGGRMRDLRWDINHGNCHLEKPKSKASKSSK